MVGEDSGRRQGRYTTGPGGSAPHPGPAGSAHSERNATHFERRDTVDARPEAAPHSRSSRIRGLRRHPELITQITRTPAQNRHHRETVYLWLQGLRLPLIFAGLGVLIAWDGPAAWIVAMILLVIGVPFPWIAVVIANGHGEPRDRRIPQVYKPAVARRQVALSQQSPRAVGRAVGYAADDTRQLGTPTEPKRNNPEEGPSAAAAQ